jgi:DNA topoisomerase VI subunit B
MEPKSAGPGVVAPTNRVTVAFPFSKIVLEEPSADIAELAAVTAELAALIETIAPGPAAAELSRRARALAARR